MYLENLATSKMKLQTFWVFVQPLQYEYTSATCAAVSFRNREPQSATSATTPPKNRTRATSVTWNLPMLPCCACTFAATPVSDRTCATSVASALHSLVTCARTCVSTRAKGRTRAESAIVVSWRPAPFASTWCYTSRADGTSAHSVASSSARHSISKSTRSASHASAESWTASISQPETTSLTVCPWPTISWKIIILCKLELCPKSV